MQTLFSLNGLTALVTGAGDAQGIGFGCAKALALQGARVAITSTTDRIFERADELRELSSSRGSGAKGVFAHVADLTSAAAATDLVAATSEALGAPTVLVNNAGMTSLTDPQAPASLAEIAPDLWRHTVERNLDPAFAVTRAALPAMLRTGFGRVINIASISGAVVAYPGDVAYHAGKAAIVGMTRALAVEVAGTGVTANAIAPGWILTPSLTEDEVAMGARTPMGRCGTPEEIGATAAFLASREAAYLTGQTIVVDGAVTVSQLGLASC